MAYRVYGLASLEEILDERVVYRSLIPADQRLPALDELRDELGLDEGIPRKAEPAYGQAVAEMLRRARALETPGTAIARVLYIGDNESSDGAAFRHLCAAGGWPGRAFIGRDTLGRLPETRIEGPLYLANRWSALPTFLQWAIDQGFVLDESLTVVIDLDKTAIGARGRNDKVIDEARVEGVRRTVAGLLGPDFDAAVFRAAYNELNQASYYGLTADNQDYLAYICLVLGAGLFTLSDIVENVRGGTLSHFADLIEQVEQRRSELVSSGLQGLHDEVYALVQAGDPTPFKAFRRNEYLTTAARFGDLPGAPIDQVLAERIVITQEVYAMVRALRAEGALTFGLSDKPDEASLPTPEQAAAGLLPLHRLQTLAVGEAWPASTDAPAT